MSDYRTRLAAIEQRAEDAKDAWEHGQAGVLWTITTEDAPWLVERVRQLSRTVEVFAERKEHGRTMRDNMTQDEMRRWRERDEYIAEIGDALLSSSLELLRGRSA